MSKKFWVVLDTDMDACTKRDPHEPRRKFSSAEDARNFAIGLAEEHEDDYYIAEVVTLATQPKAPVSLIDLSA